MLYDVRPDIELVNIFGCTLRSRYRKSWVKSSENKIGILLTTIRVKVLFGFCTFQRYQCMLMIVDCYLGYCLGYFHFNVRRTVLLKNDLYFYDQVIYHSQTLSIFYSINFYKIITLLLEFKECLFRNCTII